MKKINVPMIIIFSAFICPSASYGLQVIDEISSISPNGDYESAEMYIGSADPERGEDLVWRGTARGGLNCTSCHNFNENGAHGIGPNLSKVYYRKIGSTAGFNFSEGMRNAEAYWDFKNLDLFLYSPKNFWLKNKMNHSGVRSARDRADLIAYLMEV